MVQFLIKGNEQSVLNCFFTTLRDISRALVSDSGTCVLRKVVIHTRYWSSTLLLLSGSLSCSRYTWPSLIRKRTDSSTPRYLHKPLVLINDKCCSVSLRLHTGEAFTTGRKHSAFLTKGWHKADCVKRVEDGL